MSQVYRALKKAEKEESQQKQGEPLFGIFEEELIIPRGEEDPRSPAVDIERIEIPLKEGVSIAIAPADSFGAEQFRKLKTHIFLRSPNAPHSILITSSVPQEGKTTIAMNLAIAISQELNRKAILIDADLRRPGIYLKQSENSKGLSNYLGNHTPLAEILRNSAIKNLWIISGGTPSQRASELIGSNRMRELMNSLRDFGEDTYIILDSPPILSASEAILLSKLVDGVILVVMADRAPRGFIRKAVDSIDRQKIIGLVFNQKDLKPSKYYSKYYYRYYKK